MSFTIVMTGDEYIHSSPDVASHTRTGKVAKKGTSQTVSQTSGSMYRISSGWISNLYTKKSSTTASKPVTTNPKPTSGGTVTSSGGWTSKGNPNLASPGNTMDYAVAVGAGFLFLLIVGDMVKKFKFI